MTVIDTVRTRNEEFAQQRFTPIALGMPTMGAIVISCADPRVDPAYILGLTLGEAVVIRNIGGRITLNVVQEIALLLVIATLK